MATSASLSAANGSSQTNEVPFGLTTTIDEHGTVAMRTMLMASD